MKVFICKEAGLDCDFEVTAETFDELAGKVMGHIASDHSQLKERIIDVLSEEKQTELLKSWVRESN